MCITTGRCIIERHHVGYGTGERSRTGSLESRSSGLATTTDLLSRGCHRLGLKHSWKVCDQVDGVVLKSGIGRLKSIIISPFLWENHWQTETHWSQLAARNRLLMFVGDTMQIQFHESGMGRGVKGSIRRIKQGLSEGRYTQYSIGGVAVLWQDLHECQWSKDTPI